MEGFRAIHIGWHSPILDTVFLVITYLGLGATDTILAFSLFLFQKTRAYGIPLLAALLCSSPANQIPKHMITRERPSVLAFAHPQELWQFSSFPSGHTTSAFAFAFMMFLLTRKTKRAWVGWICLVLAALVGVSRIYRGMHWPTDVIGGLFAGCFAASFAYLVLGVFKWLPDIDDVPAVDTTDQAVP
jgi:undecaprenyl-diphosphatase